MFATLRYASGVSGFLFLFGTVCTYLCGTTRGIELTILYLLQFIRGSWTQHSQVFTKVYMLLFFTGIVIILRKCLQL